MEQIRVMIVDDHPLFREGLKSTIDRQRDMKVVAEAASAEELLDTVLKIRPDVVLMDLLMPGMSAHDAIRTISRNFPGIRVLVLSSFSGDEDIYKALQAGARGYLLKDSGGNEVLDAIRSVRSGLKRIHPGVAAALSHARTPLSKREIHVLKLIVNGCANKEIAQQLGITVGTVKSYVNSLLSKMQVRDRTQAATYAIKRGIVRLE